MNQKKYTYTESVSGKTCEVTLTGLHISTATTGKNGKLTVRGKDFATEEEASKQFEKKGWELLKKEFVFLNEEDKTPGTPKLHCLTSVGYTGALSFAGTPQGIYVYKHGWFNTAKDQADFVVNISHRGELLETIQLPKVLAWEVEYDAQTNALWMDLDHFIYKYDLNTRTFSARTSTLNKPASFLSLSDKYIAYGTHPLLRVENHDDNIVYENQFNVSTVKGSIPFCATLSQKGDILAFHNKQGEVKLLDPLTGDCRSIISHKNFGQIRQMQFLENDSLLMIRGVYESWKTHYFDVATGEIRLFPELDIPEYSTHVNDFCISADGSLLVQLQWGWAYVYNLKEKKYLYNFPLEHCIKNAHIKFVGNMLGVRTDYGCFSLYYLNE